MSAHVRIRGEKPRREPAQRHEPSAILQLDARRARPNPCLIEHEMFWRMLQIVLIPIAIRRRWRSDRVFRSGGACRGCLMFRILGRASLRVLRRAGRYRLSVRHAARDHDSSRQTSHTEPSNHREPPNCRGSAFCAPRLACKYGFCDVMLFLAASSGTTTVSPGCSASPSELPRQRLFCPPSTDPSARTTKIAFLFARSVGPPACWRYHLALFPGRYETAVALNTWPETITKLGRLGIVSVSPANTVISELLPFHRRRSFDIRMFTRPIGGVALRRWSVVCHSCIDASFAARCWGVLSGRGGSCPS